MVFYREISGVSASKNFPCFRCHMLILWMWLETSEMGEIPMGKFTQQDMRDIIGYHGSELGISYRQYDWNMVKTYVMNAFGSSSWIRGIQTFSGYKSTKMDWWPSYNIGRLPEFYDCSTFGCMWIINGYNMAYPKVAYRWSEVNEEEQSRSFWIK